ARPKRCGHGFAPGPDRPFVAPDRRADRASAYSREGSSLPPRTAQAGAPPAAARLSAEARPGGLPKPDQGTRTAPLDRKDAGRSRWKFEGAPCSGCLKPPPPPPRGKDRQDI